MDLGRDSPVLCLESTLVLLLCTGSFCIGSEKFRNRFELCVAIEVMKHKFLVNFRS